VQINNKVISQVTNFKYLGIELDAQLNWENHYNTVTNKMNQRVHLINRYKHCLSAKWLQVITYGIVLSVLDYCYPIWWNLSSIKYNKLDKILVRAAKNILPPIHMNNRNKYYIFEKLNWLTSAERYEHTSLTYVYKHIMYKTSVANVLTEFYIKIPEKSLHTRKSS